MIWPWSTPYTITRAEHGQVKPWYCIHPETEEEIRVTIHNIDYHPKTRLPYFLDFQRYIVGRPNLLCLDIDYQQEDKSLHFQAGAEFEYFETKIWVWCFNDSYPARLEVDCSELSPRLPIKIGDLERMLPHGMYLHKKYNNQKFNSLVKLRQTNVYI